MQNWRERMRPGNVWSALILAIIILTLIFLAVYVETGEKYSAFDRIPPNLRAFWFISIAQGILLLLVGTTSASHMAGRERASGTLEFHRASPTPRLEQLLGLLLGAPSLEWGVFLGTLPITFFLGLSGGLGIFLLLSLYAGIIATAGLFHSLAVFFGIYQERKIMTQGKPAGFLKGFVFIYLFVGLFTMSSQFSALYHLTCLPQYERVYQTLIADYENTPSRHHYEQNDYYRQYQLKKEAERKLRNNFLGINFPSLVLQFMVQIPLLLLINMGTARRIANAEQPIFSKAQSLCLLGVLLFLYQGSSFSALLNNPYISQTDTIGFNVALLYGATFLGIIGVTLSTPSRLLFQKGLRRCNKLNLKRISWSEDAAFNAPWMAVFLCVVASAGYLTVSWLDVSALSKIKLLLLLGLYLFSYGWALEYFRLSEHHKKGLLFAVVVSIFWLFLPIVGWIFYPLHKLSTNLALFQATSPFFGLGTALGAAFSANQIQHYGLTDVTMIANKANEILNGTVFINLGIAIVTGWLAWRERLKIKQQLKTT